jgi:hypothetical protein
LGLTADLGEKAMVRSGNTYEQMELLAMAEELDEAFDSLMAGLDRAVGEDGDDPLALDVAAATTAACLRMLTDDPVLGGQAEPLARKRSATSGAEAGEARSAVVGHLAALTSERTDLRPLLLAALRIYGGPFADHLAPLEDGSDPDRPGRLSIGEAVVGQALHVTFAPGDHAFVVLPLSYPGHDGATRRAGLVVELETFAGPLPSDAWISIDVDDLIEAIGREFAEMEVAELPVEDALGLLAHGFWVFDRTMGAADQLDEDSDLLMLRPLVDRLLVTHPTAEYAPPDVPELERRRACKDLVSWVEELDPHGAALAAEYATLLVDFAADNAGDPRRWSPRVVSELLYYAVHKVDAPVDELLVLPDLVRSAIRWSHEERGWPSDITSAALAAVDAVLPLYEDTLSDPARDRSLTGVLADMLSIAAVDTDDIVDELTVPPAGGSHPEPFDDSAVPDRLWERAQAIATEASERALELFDAEFVTLVRRVTADAARHRGTPLARGKTEIWASGVVYAVAQLNEIPGGWSPLARSAAEITDRLAGAPTTIANKARTLRDLLRIDSFPPEPRYQHSTSTAATSQLLASLTTMLNVSAMIGDGSDVDLRPPHRR